MFRNDPQFESVWTSSSEMLMSYSDAKFVSEGYARELTAAQTQAIDVDKIGDDPPVRIRAWVATRQRRGDPRPRLSGCCSTC